MVLSLIVILLLLIALGRGYRRGFVVEVATTVGYVFVIIIVKLLTPTVAGWLAHLLPMNHQPTANDQLLNSQQSSIAKRPDRRTKNDLPGYSIADH